MYLRIGAGPDYIIFWYTIESIYIHIDLKIMILGRPEGGRRIIILRRS